MATKFLENVETDGVTIIVNQGAKIETQISAKQGNVLTKEEDGLAVVLPTGSNGPSECCFTPTGNVVPNAQTQHNDDFTTELVEFITPSGDKFYVMREVKNIVTEGGNHKYWFFETDSRGRVGGKTKDELTADNFEARNAYNTWGGGSSSSNFNRNHFTGSTTNKEAIEEFLALPPTTDGFTSSRSQMSYFPEPTTFKVDVSQTLLGPAERYEYFLGTLDGTPLPQNPDGSVNVPAGVQVISHKAYWTAGKYQPVLQAEVNKNGWDTEWDLPRISGVTTTVRGAEDATLAAEQRIPKPVRYEPPYVEDADTL